VQLLQENNISGCWGNEGDDAESGIGLLLLDASLSSVCANCEAKLICGNYEALELLMHADELPRKTSIDASLPKKIALNFPTDASRRAEFVSGKRHYRCQAFSVRSHLTKSGQATAVIFSRGSYAPIDIMRVAGKYGFTARERETVKFLLYGLTSKEIATRMNISPNTVKAFIKLVMIKMNVSSRAGIIAKTLKFLG
jgi:DNA-binding CsgD family transcriptional regulator